MSAAAPQAPPVEDPTVRVYVAEETDILRVLSLLRDWHQGCAQLFPPLDASDTMLWILHVMRKGRVYLAELDGGEKYRKTLAGTLALHYSTYPWAQHVQILTNPWFYVPPAYVRWGVARELVASAQACAAAANSPLILDLISGTKAGRTEKHYELEGGQQIGMQIGYGLEARGDRSESS